VRKAVIQEILSLLNRSNHAGQIPNVGLHVTAYKNITGYVGEGLMYTQNLFAYMADLMETNLLSE
jgi:hypothetical protein